VLSSPVCHSCAQTSKLGIVPLSVRLDGQAGQSGGATSSPDAVLTSIIESLPGYFERAQQGAAADATVVIEKKTSAGEQGGYWQVRLNSALDPKEKVSSVATLEASEVELKLELQRLFIIKNLAALDLHDADVSLKLDGEAKPVYVTGEQFRVVFESSLDGYLNLINVRPDGSMCLLLPEGPQPLKVSAGVPLYVPSGGNRITVDEGPHGTEYLKAIFSTVVIDLAFLRCAEAQAKPDIADLLARAEAMTAQSRGIGGTGRNRVATADLRVQTAAKDEAKQ